MSCPIFIKIENGETRTVCVDSEEELKNMTLTEFIRRFCPGEDLDRYRYIFNGRQLQSDRALGYHGVNKYSTILIVQRIRGGAQPAQDEGRIPRSTSMEALADMQQTEPEPNR